MTVLKRNLMIFGMVFGSIALAVAVGAGLVSYALVRVEPYPAFMKDLASNCTRTYEETKQAFSRLIVQTFPIGSDAKDATKQVAAGGFQVQRGSGPNSVHMRWSRKAGPCNERYSIVVDQTVDGKIAKATGELYPTCL